MAAGKSKTDLHADLKQRGLDEPAATVVARGAIAFGAVQFLRGLILSARS